MLCGICSIVVGCKNSPDDYTLEEHIERITPRIEKRFINDETRDDKYSFITGYQGYPLYNSEDKLEYFLIEFEPWGFAFVALNRNLGMFSRDSYMYKCSDCYVKENWQRYRFGDDSNESTLCDEIMWKSKEQDNIDIKKYEIDQNGNFIEHNTSPFMVAGVLKEKLYLLDVYAGYIPAIKKDNKFINLISLENVEYKGGREFYKGLGTDYVYDNIPLLQVSFLAEPVGNL